MRPHSQVESSTPTSPVRSLPPALSHALASLDIQLEEELMRYRRLRGGQGQFVRPGSRNQPRKSPDLIAVSAPPGSNRPGEPAPPAPPIPAGNRPDAPVEHGLNRSEQASEGQPVPAYVPPTAASAFAANPHVSDLAIATAPPSDQLSAEAELPPPQLSATNGEAEGAFAPKINHRLDDYLESSEELLRSLATEEAEVQAERGFMQSLLTPLGVGSMLLLLISSAMFGYVLMNPSSLARLFSLSGAKVAGNSAGQESQAQLAPPQPNLANQEFKDLNLGTLGTLKDEGSTPGKRGANSTGTPTVPAKPTTVSTRLGAAGTSSASTSTSTFQPGSSGTLSSPVAPAPRSEPAAIVPAQPAPPVRVVDPPQPARLSLPASGRSPAPGYDSAPVKKSTLPAPVSPVPPSSSASPSRGSTASASSGAYQYKVVTQYDNDRTLETVKKVVPDAYVRNFPDGARIQVGASSSATDAEAKAQELRNQGISAEVYKP
ncbi:hypothetical protein K9N68_25050 [Kovacikia minuta CCNUW1]|uniref:hypothetical protein n=1 Tax=Kovacikia minuta TaxID=2931930 RepID=UPI001CCBF5D3|nr:hypothetical protein [Kovacikia minuta]UBF24894.1 hypothetical protein K9N68_25050 [Kovacikia minuta CCNUW1]